MRRLLIRPGGIGDCILSLPALECLKADYTEIWAPESVAPLIRFADRVRSIGSTGLDLVGLPGVDPPPATIQNLRSFDSIVSWYGSNRGEFREHVAKLGLPFRFFPALPPTDSHMHAADFFLAQAGCHGSPAIPKVCCPAATRSDFAVIHPFSGSPRKNWPLERFRELAQRLPFSVKWCAGPEEDLAGAARFTDLYELACWLATARLYIGNDSGITHLAAAVGTPVAAVFGPSDAAIWGPRGDRVVIIAGKPAGKLEEISVERVLAEICELLQR